MRPHPRIRKTIKWGGLVVGSAFVVAFAASAGRGFGVYWATQQYERSFDIARGVLVYTGYETWPPDSSHSASFSWGAWDEEQPLIKWWPVGRGPFSGTHVSLPLWMPVLASLIASTLAWRLDTLATRRAKLGACPTCSYSRAGLALSSPCPECGSAAPSA